MSVWRLLLYPECWCVRVCEGVCLYLVVWPRFVHSVHSYCNQSSSSLSNSLFLCYIWMQNTSSLFMLVSFHIYIIKGFFYMHFHFTGHICMHECDFKSTRELLDHGETPLQCLRYKLTEWTGLGFFPFIVYQEKLASIAQFQTFKMRWYSAPFLRQNYTGLIIICTTTPLMWSKTKKRTGTEHSFLLHYYWALAMTPVSN